VVTDRGGLQTKGGQVKSEEEQADSGPPVDLGPPTDSGPPADSCPPAYSGPLATTWPATLHTSQSLANFQTSKFQVVWGR
jgi:hypothetical protein